VIEQHRRFVKKKVRVLLQESPLSYNLPSGSAVTL
jgi:hypothetical protein